MVGRYRTLRWLLCLIAVAAVGSERRAEACSCVSLPASDAAPRVRLLEAEKPLPRNARLRLEYEADYVMSDDGRTPLPVSALTHGVRTSDGKPIVVQPQIVRTSRQLFVELTPVSPLPPRMQFDVVLTHPGEKEYVAGRFKTTDQVDLAPPVFGGARQAIVRATSGGQCFTTPILTITVQPATDSGSNALYYGVWMAGPNGVIDYGQPPAALSALANGALVLHGGYKCGGAGNFDIFRVYPIAGSRLGVRAFDLAGNRSEPSEVAVDVDPPDSDPYRMR